MACSQDEMTLVICALIEKSSEMMTPSNFVECFRGISFKEGGVSIASFLFLFTNTISTDLDSFKHRLFLNAHSLMLFNSLVLVSSCLAPTIKSVSSANLIRKFKISIVWLPRWMFSILYFDSYVYICLLILTIIVTIDICVVSIFFLNVYSIDGLYVAWLYLYVLFVNVTYIQMNKKYKWCRMLWSLNMSA